MDWSKHSTSSSTTRRIAVPITPQLEQLMGMFKKHHSNISFSETGVLKTFIEAGAKQWYQEVIKDDKG